MAATALAGLEDTNRPPIEAVARPAVPADARHIANGWTIPSEGYADQPYVVPTGDGAWLCVMTTGRGAEGARGQHVIALRSTDRGRSWSRPVDIEPADGPEASYAVLLKTPGGRVYCFYNHNTDNVREVKTETGGVLRRVDSLGCYVFKFSDDHGRTWSPRRYPVSVREFECDRSNVYGGRVRFFWNVGRPLVHAGAALLTLHKVGAMGAGFFAQSEGVFLRSENLLLERDPEKISFVTLPEGETGLRAPPGGGRIAEEQSVAALSDGSLYCVYRTVDGWPASAYSRDGGRHWTTPAYASYTPGGRRLKHPRAANFVWRCANGQYLYWFHNHGGKAAQRQPGWDPYADRNPVWLAAGIERDSPAGKVLHWSQPEVLLYDDDPFIRMSYPDLIEEDGALYVTETQKNVGRVHELPAGLIAGLFGSWENRQVATNGLLLALPGAGPMPRESRMPRLPEFHQRDSQRADHGGRDMRAGFTLDLRLKLRSLAAGQTVLDSRDDFGRGLLLATADNAALQLTLSDGRQQSGWASDGGLLRAGQAHQVAVVVDGGPKIILFVIDGILCDGGDERQFGWGRFSPTLRSANGTAALKVAPSLQGEVSSLRVYGRALRTSEVVGNHRAGGELRIEN